MEMLLKSGSMYKLGDGPVNYDWNLRFFVLNCKTLVSFYSFRSNARVNIFWK